MGQKPNETIFTGVFLVWIPWLVTVRICCHIWKQKRKEKQSGYLGQLTGLENLWPGIEQECQRWYRDTKILSAKKVSKIGLGNNSKVDLQVRKTCLHYLAYLHYFHYFHYLYCLHYLYYIHYKYYVYFVYYMYYVCYMHYMHYLYHLYYLITWKS